MIILLNVFLMNKWYQKSIMLFISAEYTVLRTYGIVAFKFFPFHLLILAVPLVFYSQEKYQKQIYYYLFQKNKDLRGWKTLLNKSLPLSIFVVGSQKNNEKALGMKFCNT